MINKYNNIIKFPIRVYLDDNILKSIPEYRLKTGDIKVFKSDFIIYSLLIMIISFAIKDIEFIHKFIRVGLIIISNIAIILSTIHLIKSIKTYQMEKLKYSKKAIKEFQEVLPFVSSNYLIKKDFITIKIRYFKNHLLQEIDLSNPSEEDISIFSGIVYYSNLLKDKFPDVVNKILEPDNKLAVFWSLNNGYVEAMILTEDNELILKEIFDIGEKLNER